jgi:hemolysin III
MYYGERLNAISHLVGAVLALVGLGALLAVAIQVGRPLVITGFSIFGASLVLLYTMSTLYHSFPYPRVKTVFKVLDHISIYLLIAGSYTPFMLITMPPDSGLMILALVWTLAVLGTLSEIYLYGRAVKIAQVTLFLGMGWSVSLDLTGLREGLPPAGYLWVLIGGLAYTGGVVFYVLDKMRRLDHAHGIWHLFVLMGSISHFIAVIRYVR